MSNVGVMQPTISMNYGLRAPHQQQQQLPRPPQHVPTAAIYPQSCAMRLQQGHHQNVRHPIPIHHHVLRPEAYRQQAMPQQATLQQRPCHQQPAPPQLQARQHVQPPQHSLHQLHSPPHTDGQKQLQQPQVHANTPTVTVELHRKTRQICPTCSGAFDTLEEAREHWLAQHGPSASAAPVAASPKHIAGSTSESATAAAPQQSSTVSTVRCSVILSDEKGQPIIVRHADPESGAERTIVMNEDGSQRIFGERTIASLTTKDEDDVKQWLDHMTNVQMRGFVHEFTMRLCDMSNEYHTILEELQKKSKLTNLSYFGLTSSATEKDIEKAYKRLSREMHPDKNGGTDEAKELFQAMRKRYEDLREQLASGDVVDQTEPSPVEKTEQQQESQHEPQQDSTEEDIEAKKDEVTEADASDANSQDQREAVEDHLNASTEEAVGASSKVETPSRSELEKSAWRMLRQIKFIALNTNRVKDELLSVDAELSAKEVCDN